MLLPTARRLLPVALSGMRGGGVVPLAGEPFDLTRARVRLEGLSSYGVMSAFLMNAALRVYTSTPRTLKPDRRLENVVTIAFSISCAIAVASGLYTTITFTMLSLYAKTAIGMGKYPAYVQLLDATASMRRSGFLAYVLSLLSFSGAFASSAFLTNEGALQFASAGLVLAFAGLSWRNIKLLLDLASVLLFDGE